MRIVYFVMSNKHSPLHCICIWSKSLALVYNACICIYISGCIYIL